MSLPKSPTSPGFGTVRSPPVPIPLALRSAGTGSIAGSLGSRPAFISSPLSASNINMVPGSENQPHLVSLVLQSKKALQHGEHLCTRAHAASNASAQAAVDVLALDAKVRWVVEAVTEQLTLAASVAKCIEEKRTHLRRQIEEWDTARAKHTDALDSILEALGSQLVPPEFHQTSADSSLFGSQHGSDDEGDDGGLFSEPTSRLPPANSSRSPPSPAISPRMRNGTNRNGYSNTNGRLSSSPVSPSATLRRNDPVRKYVVAELNLNGAVSRKGKARLSDASMRRKEDRRHWKTLRDFVDDQAIEDTMDIIESDRLALDDILSSTEDYPETLTRTINSIQASLPYPEADDPGALKRVREIVVAQENAVRAMAAVLENLASHYDGMATALKDTENGDAFTNEELQVMNRDTEELPTIMSEMERDMNDIDGHHDQLKNTKENLEKDLDHLHTVLDKLDELGEIISEMLQTQDKVEVKADEDLNGLQQHLTTLSHLHEQFLSYRTAFNKLLLEIARRRQYREAAENIVKGMMRQLDSMTEEESRVRAHFNAEYGSHLPEDLCLCIGNAPTRWDVVPWEGTSPEVLPFIANDLIAEARERVGYSEGTSGAESL